MKKRLIFCLILLTSCTMNSRNKEQVKRYEWFASGNAPKLYPTELFFGDFIFSNKKRLYIPPSIPFGTIWGRSESMHLLGNNRNPAPSAIDIIWLSLVENQFYSLEAALPKEKIAGLLAEVKEEDPEKQKYDFIVAGMAPYGGLAIWLTGGGIRTEVAWLQAEPVDIDMKDFSPNGTFSQKEYVEFYLPQWRKKAYENLQKNGLPDRMLFERYMQRFNYRITPELENEEAVFKRKSIRMYYYNGELNELNTGEHEQISMRAKPSKISLRWHIGDTRYDGHFFMNEKNIINTFSDFYDVKQQKEGSLEIEIKKSNKEFNFLLKNGSIVTEIPIEDVRFLIFKNDYEFYRSDNYDKAPGHWDDQY